MTDEAKWVWRQRLRTCLRLYRRTDGYRCLSEGDLSDLLRKRAECGPNLSHRYGADELRRLLGEHPNGADATWLIPDCSMVMGPLSQAELVRVLSEEDEEEPGWIVEGRELRMSESRKLAIRNQVRGAQAYYNYVPVDQIEEGGLNWFFHIYARYGDQFEDHLTCSEMFYAHGPQLGHHNDRFIYRGVHRVIAHLSARQFAQLDEYRRPDTLTERQRSQAILEQLRGEMACLNGCDPRRITHSTLKRVVRMQAENAPNFHFAFSEQELFRWFDSDEIERRSGWELAWRVENVLGSLSQSELVEIADFEPGREQKKAMRRSAHWGQLSEEMCMAAHRRLSASEVRGVLRLYLDCLDGLGVARIAPEILAVFEVSPEDDPVFIEHRLGYWLKKYRRGELEFHADAMDGI
jgi:hypothetical protein